MLSFIVIDVGFQHSSTVAFGFCFSLVQGVKVAVYPIRSVEGIHAYDPEFSWWC